MPIHYDLSLYYLAILQLIQSITVEYSIIYCISSECILNLFIVINISTKIANMKYKVNLPELFLIKDKPLQSEAYLLVLNHQIYLLKSMLNLINIYKCFFLSC
jgi:hypothetical protein